MRNGVVGVVAARIVKRCRYTAQLPKPYNDTDTGGDTETDTETPLPQMRAATPTPWDANKLLCRYGKQLPLSFGIITVAHFLAIKEAIAIRIRIQGIGFINIDFLAVK